VVQLLILLFVLLSFLYIFSPSTIKNPLQNTKIKIQNSIAHDPKRTNTVVADELGGVVRKTQTKVHDGRAAVVDLRGTPIGRRGISIPISSTTISSL
jgi:hypothetical protein